MTDIQLTALGITVQRENHAYLDLGFVPDVTEFTKQVYKMWMGSEEGIEKELEKYRHEKPGARVMSLTLDNNTIWIAFYQYSASNITNLYRLGHEQAHVLHAIGQIYLLQEKLEQKGLDIELRGYEHFEKCSHDEKELVADIGAFYVLGKYGVDVLKLPSEQNSQLISANLAWYQNALRNSRITT